MNHQTRTALGILPDQLRVMLGQFLMDRRDRRIDGGGREMTLPPLASQIVSS